MVFNGTDNYTQALKPTLDNVPEQITQAKGVKPSGAIFFRTHSLGETRVETGQRTRYLISRASGRIQSSPNPFLQSRSSRDIRDFFSIPFSLSLL